LYAAGVSHEINNPVGFVETNLGKLLDHYQILETILGKEKDMRADGALQKALENIKGVKGWDRSFKQVKLDQQSLRSKGLKIRRVLWGNVHTSSRR